MRFVLVLLSVVFLAGCVQHTTMIKPLPESKQGVLNIKNVSVTYSELSSEKIVGLDEKLKNEALESGDAQSIKSESLKTVLAQIVKGALEQRDSSDVKYADVEIEVDNLKFVNPMAAILISDTDQLSGTVKVVDSKTQELVSEFYVDVLKGTGGLLGLAVRGGGVREKLSAQFAEYIGDNLGFKPMDSNANHQPQEED